MVKSDEIMMMLISQQNQITKLNDEIKELRKKISNHNKSESTGLIVPKEVLEEEKFDKNDIIRFIRLEMSGSNFDTLKASREEGGGVIFKNKETGQQKVSMLRRSRNYVYDNPIKFSDYVFRSWHTMDASLVDKYDLFIFSVEGTITEPVNFFIFSKEEIENILEMKHVDKNDKYHFYFIKNKNGQILEDRDCEINVKKYFNDWNIKRD